jgi:pimeloyl-ACP methyl ester carboxylesterase
VSLHSWSASFDRYDSLPSTLRGCVKRGWIFISPDFRGPNVRPEACGSDLAVRDVLDAVAFAQKAARVDDSRIYLLGGSGGGHMALLMACRARNLWAGISVACPITDLLSWHRFCQDKKYRYAEMMRACFNGPPGDPVRDTEYRRRSPMYCLATAKGISIDIETGILDGHAGRAVPVDHSLRAFNVLLEANGISAKKLTQEEIEYIRREARLPSSLSGETDNEPGRKYPVLFRRDAGVVRLTLYDAGHDFDAGTEESGPPSLHWLEKQSKKPVSLYNPDSLCGFSSDFDKVAPRYVDPVFLGASFLSTMAAETRFVHFSLTRAVLDSTSSGSSSVVDRIKPESLRTRRPL